MLSAILEASVYNKQSRSCSECFKMESEYTGVTELRIQYLNNFIIVVYPPVTIPILSTPIQAGLGYTVNLVFVRTAKNNYFSLCTN